MVDSKEGYGGTAGPSDETIDMHKRARQDIAGAELQAEEAETSRREHERAEREARQRYKVEVMSHPELSDHEKAGWLLAIDNEDPPSAAETIADKLSRIEELVSHADTPVVYASFRFGREIQMFHTDGSGMALFREKGDLSPGIGSFIYPDDRHVYPNLHHLPPRHIAEAVIEAEDIEELDTEKHHTSTYMKSDMTKDTLIIGTDAVRTYFEKLLIQEAEKEDGRTDRRRKNESLLVEKLLQQTPPDSLDALLGSSERLQEWFEAMKADRLDLFAKHLIDHAGHRVDSLRPVPEAKDQISKLYGIGLEDIRQRALELHGEFAAKVREELESGDVGQILGFDSDET